MLGTQCHQWCVPFSSSSLIALTLGHHPQDDTFQCEVCSTCSIPVISLHQGHYRQSPGKCPRKARSSRSTGLPCCHSCRSPPPLGASPSLPAPQPHPSLLRPQGLHLSCLTLHSLQLLLPEKACDHLSPAVQPGTAHLCFVVQALHTWAHYTLPNAS